METRKEENDVISKSFHPRNSVKRKLPFQTFIANACYAILLEILRNILQKSQQYFEDCTRNSVVKKKVKTILRKVIFSHK